jgi:hypothetical protein
VVLAREGDGLERGVDWWKGRVFVGSGKSVHVKGQLCTYYIERPIACFVTYIEQ